MAALSSPFIHSLCLLAVSFCCRCPLLFAQIELTKFNLIPPFDSDSASVTKQLTVARDTYELGVLLAVLNSDIAAFQRNYAQLRPYYLDYAKLLPPSQNQANITALHLLHLLAQNQLADFHSELELLAFHDENTGHGSSSQGQPSNTRQATGAAGLVSSPQLQYAVQLEQYLMEGCYHKLFSTACPLPHAQLFLDSLRQGVRERIAESAEAAYERYPIGRASRMLMFDVDGAKGLEELLLYVKGRGWGVEADDLVLPRRKEENVAVNQLETIAQSLHYASELERIV